MFNENVNDMNDVVPSKPIISLRQMIKDIYSEHEERNTLTELQMQKIFINLDNKYTLIDKIILLLYGVTNIEAYAIDKEMIPIERFDKKNLTEKELECKELESTKLIIETNNGTLIIGYDYAYMRKQTYTPNIILNEHQKQLTEDERVIYNIDYPYVYVKNNDIYILPIVEYNVFITQENPKYKTDCYHINVDNNVFEHKISSSFIDTTELQNIDMNIDNYMMKEFIPVKCSYVDDNKKCIIIDYKNKDDENIKLQYIIDDINISVIYNDTELNEIIKKTTYFM